MWSRLLALEVVLVLSIVSMEATAAPTNPLQAAQPTHLEPLAALGVLAGMIACLATAVAFAYVCLRQSDAEFQRSRKKVGPPALHARQTSDQMTVEAAWNTLGVPPGAAFEAVREAYLALAHGWHPDRMANCGEQTRQLALQRMCRLNAAYQTLEEQYATGSYGWLKQPGRLTRPA